MSALIAALSGFLFGLGLLISGMNDPAKVRGFLDIFGDWQPALIAVMGGAVVVFFVAFRFSKKQARPWLAERFNLPALTAIDARLLLGAVMFGIGWGLVGLCPGPALVDLLSGHASILWFVGALLVGNRLAHWLVGPASTDK